MKRLFLSLFLLAGFASLQAQEAFYIYRNDGDFDGFFYDEVISMNASKFDLDSIEHEEYVVQEIITTDSTYRIPLCAIDSISFQQPEIILNERLHNLFSEDINEPYSYSNTFWGGCGEYQYSIYPQITEMYPITEDTKVFTWWPYKKNDDGSSGEYNEEKHLPKVGDVLAHYSVSPHDGQTRVSYIVKVAAVKKLEGETDLFIVYCEPVDNFGDVFEQFVTVERLGKDENGQYVRRMAGLNKIRKRVSGNKELSIISLNGSFPVSLYGGPDIDISMSLDLSLDVKARATYNISRWDYYINIEFEENAEVGATLSAKGTMEDVTKRNLTGAAIYFPTFLPILQVNPAPGAFLKTSGDISLKLTTPKLAFHGTQNITISPKGLRGTRTQSTGKDDPNNTWGLELSLNGSAHVGTYFPFNIETNTWVKKIFWCSTGIDVYVGPKLSASFTLDPVALANGENVYSTLGGTNIGFSTVCAAFEGTAKFSAGTQYEEEFKIFEGEANLASINLRLFPDFDETQVSLTPKTYDYWHNLYPTTRHYSEGNQANVIVYPRKLSVPFYIGAAVYNADKELIGKGYYEKEMYGFFNSYAQTPTISLPILQGKYSIVPLINVMGFDVPAWSKAKTIESTLDLAMEFYDDNMRAELDGWSWWNMQRGSGWLYVYGLMPGDTAKFEIDDNSGFIFTEQDQVPVGYDGHVLAQRYTWSYERPDRVIYPYVTVTVTGKDGSVRQIKYQIQF